LFREASIFVLPCTVSADGDRDGIPNVILEALAMKVPVVTTAVSGIPEIIRHLKTGLLAKQGDAGSLTGSLLDLLNYPELGDALANEGYERVREMFSNNRNLMLLGQLLDAASTDADNDRLAGNQRASTV
jgi:glycosyltransferase involved in cell wall biosynthesis